MGIELTQLSANAYDRIRLGDMTPQMASEYLAEGRIVLRSFREVLSEMYPGGDLQERLIEAFRDDESSLRSVTKKIQNWLSGKNAPTRREDVFRIAFALNLTEPQTNYLLGQCTEYGIHYREGRDLVYSWFLRRGMRYEQARDFYRSLPPIPLETETAVCTKTHVTRRMQTCFQACQSQEDLRTCYLEHMRELGIFHARAHHYFRRYLDLLIHPTPDWMDTYELDYSVEAVMDKYLSLKMPSGKRRTGYTTTQKLIKRNWPNATALKNIRARREDVPRKLLLLLYVITENAVDNEYSELDEDYLPLAQRLEDHWWVLNAILTDCGMPTMDPRNAFDWLILYAVTATEEESMSERMEKVIQRIFTDLPTES